MSSPEQYTEDYYLESCGGAEFFKRYGASVLKPVLAHALKRAEVKAGMAALDVGCGRGELLLHLRQKGVKAVGIDYAAPGLELARKTSGAEVMLADAKKLPFADASFDRIFLLGVVDHLRDWELEACFAEFKRVLKPGGRLLANTCVNTEYHKTLTYELRKTVAAALGLKEPSPPRSSEDQELHVNEHCAKDLERLFLKTGWKGAIEFRPSEKHVVRELYGETLPEGFPIKPATRAQTFWHGLLLAGPWKRLFARELFCVVEPR
jgi:ubiquinone/menaquinone biosynthesis C-methylase UbiE